MPVGTVDRLKRKPLLRDRVRDRVLELIEHERLTVGDRLMPEKAMAARFDCSFLTVRAALEDLVGQGVLDRRPGSGTFLKRQLHAGSNGGALADRMVAVVLGQAGHLHSDLGQALMKQLQGDAFIPISLTMEVSADGRRALVRQLQELSSHGCRRLILAASVNDDLLEDAAIRGLLQSLFEVRVQAINLVVPDPSWGVHCVTMDLKAGHRMAVEHLKGLGHRRIVYLAGDMTECESNRIYARAYTDAMIDAAIGDEIRVRILRTPILNPTAQIRVILEEDKPTAILGMMDYRSALAGKAMRELGVAVPEQVALVGYFNTPFAEHEDMTSVDINIAAIAEKAVAMLALPVDAPPEVHVIQPSLVVRASTGSTV